MDSQPSCLMKGWIGCARLGHHGATKGTCFRAAVAYVGFFQPCYQGIRKCLQALQKRALHHLTELTKEEGRHWRRQAGRQHQRCCWDGVLGFNHAVVTDKQKPEHVFARYRGCLIIAKPVSRNSSCPWLSTIVLKSLLVSLPQQIVLKKFSVGEG